MALRKKSWSLKRAVLGNGNGKGKGKESSSSSSKQWSWPWKSSSAFNWKRGVDFQVKIIDNLVFRVLYVVEAIVLVSTLCLFYLCCGCHI